ncbi:MAG: AAA family ATPase [Paeniclostridium sordellii]|uniref:AAA family ATPase n=1 Tax=Paeniclostridium hominis TaxID=2764329 RepID=A0ABR7K029_9FIRM|nr:MULTISPECIES: DEAD/DEAH box helicase [Paeniclostridium]MBC6002460.1 AAA family ATPase [Paeniclostridium hominis]MDU1539597.1 AAA family ATPase [Paeniclostridium sordellii]
MSQYININSELDALKIKEFEEIFYQNMKEEANVVPKVTPFKGINTDLLYIKDERVLFIKFMDTTEDLFMILEDELLEIMEEEYDLLRKKMSKIGNNINYNYVFVMPYVTIYDNEEYNDFVENNIIDKNKLYKMMNYEMSIDEYLSESNDEILLNLFLLQVCPEYYVINDNLNLNKKLKKISFSNEDYRYTATMLERDQIEDIVSIKYGNTLYKGPSGCGKTTILLSRAIKLARVYPHHKFIIFTHTKQLRNEIKERLDILYKDNNNIEVHTFTSFLFKLAKIYNLVFDYNTLKNTPEKVYKSLVLQAKNTIKNRSMFKGIFIDEIESFESSQLDFIREFLYKSKFIFNGFECKGLNISSNLSIFKDSWSNIKFDNIITLTKNYRQSNHLVEFVNNFDRNSNEYIKSIRSNVNDDIYYLSNPIRESNKAVDIIKVSDIEEQISSILWEIEYLTHKKGLNYSDIAVVYPFNKKRLKNGKTIYFQYMLKKDLEENDIPYVYGDDELTNISKKAGVTISNIYSIKNLEYKAIIFCELEMLYNHSINDITQDYQVNDFVGDLNKVYLAINRATDYLSIITTFNESASDIIKLLVESKK